MAYDFELDPEGRRQMARFRAIVALRIAPVISIGLSALAFFFEAFRGEMTRWLLFCGFSLWLVMLFCSDDGRTDIRRAFMWIAGLRQRLVLLAARWVVNHDDDPGFWPKGPPVTEDHAVYRGLYEDLARRPEHERDEAYWMTVANTLHHLTRFGDNPLVRPARIDAAPVQAQGFVGAALAAPSFVQIAVRNWKLIALGVAVAFVIASCARIDRLSDDVREAHAEADVMRDKVKDAVASQRATEKILSDTAAGYEAAMAENARLARESTERERRYQARIRKARDETGTLNPDSLRGVVRELAEPASADAAPPDGLAGGVLPNGDQGAAPRTVSRADRGGS